MAVSSTSASARDIVEYLQTMVTSVKLYHWSTRSHARHVASDQLMTELLPAVDRLVEVFIGRYARPECGRGLTLRIPALGDDTAADALREYGRWLKVDFPKYCKANDTDILNLRDALMESLHQALYRFTLV